MNWQRAALGGFVALALATPGRSQDADVAVSPDARASAERGLAWLLSAQNTDGSWGREPNTRGEVGNTSVAALTLLAHGSTLTRGPHHRPLRRAFEWLQRRTRDFGADTRLDQGTLLQQKLGPSAELYLVTLLYAQALGLGLDRQDDERMQRELRAMVRSIADRQKPNGEWETSYEPMLTTISAWLALKQADAAGIAIETASPQRVVRYLLEDCLERSTGVFREAKWGRQERFVTQAGAIRVLHGENLTRDADVARATEVVVTMRFDQDVGTRTGGEEFLGALYATQALHIAGRQYFAAWYPKIVKGLAGSQNANGSWQGHHCITDRVFCTACSVMTLLVPDKLVPMAER